MTRHDPPTNSPHGDPPPGMHGSGMFVINPPFALPERLGETLPFLVDRLGQDPTANHRLRWEIP